MRELKFRAWDKAKKKMIFTDNPFHAQIIASKIAGVSTCGYDIEIMQYTGLKDRNGKEIYEGDIISTDLDRPFNIVVFRNGAFVFQCHDNGKDYYDYMFWEYGEIIGNIYENPELLKGDENA